METRRVSIAIAAQNLLIFAKPSASVQQSLTFTDLIRKNPLVHSRLALAALLGTFLYVFFLCVITAPMLCLSCKKDHNTTPFPEETGFAEPDFCWASDQKCCEKHQGSSKCHQCHCCVGNRTNPFPVYR